MLAYYAIHDEMVGEGPPRGIFVRDVGANDALLWNHRSRAWQYNPDLVGRFLSDDRNWDRYEPVDRVAAERVTREITLRSCGFVEELPDEDTIYWIFQWKGAPPQSEG